MAYAADVKQKLNMEAVQRIIGNHKKDSASRYSVAYSEIRLEKLRDAWKECEKQHAETHRHWSHNAELLSSYMAEYTKLEELVLDYVTFFKAKLHELYQPATVQPTSAAIHDSLKLERIKVPSFDGNYSEWCSFRDLYQSIVHTNSQLAPVQKMQYLRNALRGDAEALIRHLSVTDTNYEVAWTLLSERYDNDRAIAQEAIQRLFDIRTIAPNDHHGLKQLLDTTNQFLASIKQLEINEFDLMTIFILNRKIDDDARSEWQKKLSVNNDMPSLDSFLEFIKQRFVMLEALAMTRKNKLSKVEKRPSVSAHTSHITKHMSCVLCQGPHSLVQCEQFRKVKDKQTIVATHKLCSNCLSKNHKLNQCPSKRQCKICKKRHNTLLHEETLDSAVLSHHINGKSSSKQVLLATALMKVKSISGVLISLRVLFDSGSQNSFISESAVQLLGIPRKHAKFQISGIGSTTGPTTKGIVKIEAAVRNLDGEKEIIEINPYVLSTVTAPLPSEPIKLELPDGMTRSDLADPLFNQPSAVDVLIGADTYNLFMLPGTKIGHPCAQQTKLGWVLIGATQCTTKNPKLSSHVCSEDLDELLRKFWEIEELSSKKSFSHNEKLAEEMYQQSVSREVSGKYIVNLPFEPHADITNLCQSEKVAFIRFRQLEKRLQKNKILYEKYANFMKEYLDLGHMQLVHDQNIKTPGAYYLPHHAVFKDSSSTTKLRVVFNASQKTPQGKSLNDLLLVGPSIQNNILHILMRWRQHKFVMMADIEKMYRQIWIADVHQNHQRILWRFDPRKPIQHYQLKTVTYGTASAPFLAIRTLHQLALDDGRLYPEAASVLLNDFYVDDVLTGSDNLTDLEKLQRDLRHLLAGGGFHLRKWASNHPRLLTSIPIEDQEINVPLDITTTENVKTLGLQWHPAKDVFTFDLQNISTDGILTKRSILSEIAKLFDPLGWLQPCIIVGKITMQKLWLSKCHWDEPLDPALIQNWLEVRSDLISLKTLNIPRWIGYSNNNKIELHGYCDASCNAYAAVVYLKVWNTTNTKVQLLAAKSKVAPLKTISIPRLELCGAVLLVELMKQIAQAHNWQHVPKYYWTDSTIVLSWLHSSPSKWKVFVANRVSTIQQESSPCNWYHVDTRSNPADLATRGITPTQLLSANLWWYGPEWLKVPTSDWKLPVFPTHVNLEDEERKISLTTFFTAPEPEILGRFSNVTKLFRVVAYSRRFANNTMKAGPKLSGPLTIAELKSAETICIRLSQQHAFSSEIDALRKNKEVPQSSNIRALCPWISPEGILRVGGRIHLAMVGETMKHPAIIPKGTLGKLLMQKAHKETLHGGAQLTLATSRLQYWIVSGHSVAKETVRKCLTCFKLTAKPKEQLFGNLPRSRVQLEKPFMETGLDYAGPITMKWNNGRGAKTTKAYIAVFVCMATKAFHLELASDLSAKTCIAAIRRFIARRGKCRTIFSDCGTNFIGANKQLRQEYSKVLKESSSELVNEGIQWNFIPPGSPHFGGLWEAGVKSMKRHLLKTIGSQILNVEELYTLLAQIEACLNSRPLTDVSTDPSDPLALTPGHFLTGSNLFEITTDPAEMKHTVINRWKLIQFMKQSFWRRWSQQYLQKLQERPKWLKQQPNVQIGDLILVKMDNFPSLKWPLARVVATHPGPDGLVRVVTLKMNGKFTKRPITKICPLPFNHQKEKDNPTTHSTDTKVIVDLTEPEAKRMADPAEIITPPETKKRRVAHKPTSRTPVITALFTALMIFGIGSHATVNVTQLPAGLYTEHAGLANIERGSLHLHIRLPWKQINKDQTTLTQVSNRVADMCKKGLSISKEINCESLVSHIHELNEDIQQKINKLRFMKTRTKRGLLGRMLTAVFGVNDEIIADVNNLEENQNTMKKALSHEGKIILQATKVLNITSARVDAQLQRFTDQLNQGLNRINDYSRWYKITDHNKINLHFLSTYQCALNYIQELFNRYSTISNSVYTKTGLWEFIKIAELEATINKTQSALPPHLSVLHTTTDHLLIIPGEQYLDIDGKLPIIDTRDYELSKITAVPACHRNNTCTAIDIESSILGVNYNNQLYFKTNEQTVLQSKEIISGRYILPVSILFDLRKHPNCIITQLYNSHSTETCTTHAFHLQSLIWKQLLNRNTWMFISPNPTGVQTLCNGSRSDLLLNGTGVILLSQDCTLFSKEFILVPDHTHTNDQFLSYMKPKEITINSALATTDLLPINTTKFIKSTETFASVASHQEMFMSTLETIKWKQIKHHAWITGISIPSILLLISIFLYIQRKFKHRHRPEENHATTVSTPTWYDIHQL